MSIPATSKKPPISGGSCVAWGLKFGSEMGKNQCRLMFEAQVLALRWIRYYNQTMPYSRLGGQTPAPHTVVPIAASNSEFSTIAPES